MRLLTLCLLACAFLSAQQNSPSLMNHGRPLRDAHNCYPYMGQWTDRIDRALSTGYPVAIEQDLAWAVDPATGKGRVVVSHQLKTTGNEPSLRDHFFERVRPIVEQALRDNNRAQWPIITLHFDFKDNRPELLHAVWDLLGEYNSWITTAPTATDPHVLTALSVRPLLVLTEDNDAQEEVFFKVLKPGTELRLFGSAHTAVPQGMPRQQLVHWMATAAPAALLTERPTNYRRWWNNSWLEVEEGGQTKAGDWTIADQGRLKALVDHAHALGFWIRFYTLDGFTEADNKGWGESYNFGSHDAAVLRWKAAYAAGVDLIASDQYEELAATFKALQGK